MEPAEQRRYLEAAQQLLLLCRDRVLAAGAAEDTGLFGAPTAVGGGVICAGTQGAGTLCISLVSV